MAAELRLNVALDVAYFRQQLPKLAQAAAGFQLPIGIRFDRRALTDEIRLLSNQLGRRQYQVKIDDSQIQAAERNAEKLVKYLNNNFKNKKWYVDIEYRETGKPSTGAAGKAQHIAGGYEYIRQQAAKRAGGPVDISEAARREELRGALGRLSSLKQIKQLGKQLGVGGISKFKLAEKQQLIDKIVGEAAVDRMKQVLNPQMRMSSGVSAGVNSSISRLINRMSLVSSDPKAARAAMRGLPPKYITTDLAGKATEQAMANIALGQTQLPVGSKFQNSFDKYLQSVVGQAMADASLARQRYMARTSPIHRLGPATIPPVSPAVTRGPLYLPEVSSAPLSTRQQMRVDRAYQRSAERGAAVMGAGGGGGFGGGPRPALGPGGPGPGGALALVPQTRLNDSYFKNAQRYATALDIASKSAKNFAGSNLPLVGGLRGVAAEFGEATKQVLLYGTAYKGLAFITSLPGQILNAAKSQQQFTNSMQVATQQTGTFAKELLFVDNVQRAFGLDLETTRNGFMRLYASMAPTGFDSGSIEKLFTGISAATAALQLTPDKAERVIYAFGQMASKGQAMSEEIKGQLGDVLPGALSVFADAAGMSVQEFNQALEDGVFKGKEFRDLMAGVTDELINRFSTGAQAAGKSLQGLINAFGGEFRRTLESFAPLADGAAQSILIPLTGAMRQLGMSGQIATGEIARVASQLEKARRTAQDVRNGGGTEKQIRAAEQNVASLEAKYRQLNDAIKDPAVQKQVNEIQKFVEELSKAGTAVLGMAQAIGDILGPVLKFFGTNLTGVVTTLTSLYLGFQTARLAAAALMGTLLLLKGVSAALGMGTAAQQATALAGAFNVLGVAATRTTVATIGLRTALTALVATTVVGAIVAGVALIAGAFAGARDRAREAAKASEDFANSARNAAYTGGVAQAQMAVQGILNEERKNKAALDTIEQIFKTSTKQQRGGVVATRLTPLQEAALSGSPLTQGLLGPYQGGARTLKRVPTASEMGSLRGQFGSVSGVNAAQLRTAKASLTKAQEVAAATGQNVSTPTPTGTTDVAETGKEKTTPAALLDLTRRLNKAKEEGHLIDQIELQYQIDVVNANKEQEDAVGRMIALEDARHKRQKALQDLGKRLAKEAYGQIERETEGRREVNRLMVEARFAAGQITAKERDRLLFIQGQIDALDRFKKIPGVTPDDVAAFEARQAATPKPGSIGELYKNTKGELDDLTDSTKFLGEAANGIGSAFAKSFTDILTGAQTWKEGLAGAFKSVASMFADMVAQMLAKWAALQIISMFAPGGNSGGAKPPLPGSVALTAANGAVWKGGFTPFANGGVVKGPTLGLVGEGRFNEAVVPLPDGKKIPVELGGGAGNNVSTNIVVNMNNGQASSQMSGNGGQALGREIEGAVRNVIMKESRPGGLIYSGR